LIEDHIGLADAIARSVLHKHTVPAHVEREEIVATAREALVNACNSFDPRSGEHFGGWDAVSEGSSSGRSSRVTVPRRSPGSRACPRAASSSCGGTRS
jgi:hypothetical protein